MNQDELDAAVPIVAEFPLDVIYWSDGGVIRRALEYGVGCTLCLVLCV